MASASVRTALRGMLLPLGLLVIGALAGFGWLQLQRPQYVATSTVFVAAQRGANLADLSQGVRVSEQLIDAYAAIVPTPAVLDPAIDTVGLSESAVDLAKQITVTNPQGTVVLQIAVTDPSAARAARIANAVTESLDDVAQQLTPPTADTSAPIRFVTMQRATAPPTPRAPGTTQAVAAGAGAGLALALLIALVRDAIRTQDHKRQVQEARRLERERAHAG